MFNKKETIIFFAGAEAFHTLIHTVFMFSGTLPATFFFMTLTPTLNLWAVLVNAAITAGLLWWASRV